MPLFSRRKPKSKDPQQDPAPRDDVAGPAASDLPSSITEKKSNTESGFYLEVGKATDQGRVRSHNEDSLLVFPVKESAIPGGLFVIADGMGGHAAGEVASGLAIATMERQAQTHWPETTDEPAQAELVRWVELANQEVFEAASAQYNGMGTTVTAALVLAQRAYVANVGDSRTYLWHAGTLERVTTDHSLVMMLLQAGQIAPDDIYTHPRRNEIYRALGTDPHVEVQALGPIDLAPGDGLLLCSDGLWEMVRDPEIQATLERISTAQAACEELVRLANAHGGQDNISLILIKMT